MFGFLLSGKTICNYKRPNGRFLLLTTLIAKCIAKIRSEIVDSLYTGVNSYLKYGLK